MRRNESNARLWCALGAPTGSASRQREANGRRARFTWARCSITRSRRAGTSPGFAIFADESRKIASLKCAKSEKSNGFTEASRGSAVSGVQSTGIRGGTDSPLRFTATAADSRTPHLKRSREGWQSAFNFSKCSLARRRRGDLVSPTSRQATCRGWRRTAVRAEIADERTRGRRNLYTL